MLVLIILVLASICFFLAAFKPAFFVRVDLFYLGVALAFLGLVILPRF
jgi:hypothetical protein